MSDILEYKNYCAEVHFSAKDEVFFGKILGINDLVTFEGSTVKELKKEFQDAVEDYLSTCEELGKKPEKTYKGTFNVRIPSELHRQAAWQANINNMTLNDYVKKAIVTMVTTVSETRTRKLILIICTIISPALLAGFLFN